MDVATIKFISRFHIRILQKTKFSAIKHKMKKMNAKRNLVSFLAIATVLFLAATVAAVGQITDDITVEVNGIVVAYGSTLTGAEASVVAGDTISVKVYFTADDLDSDTTEVDGTTSNVRIMAELEADKEDSDAVTTSFDVEAGKTYVKTLTLVVPSDFEDDEVSAAMTLSLKIWNGDFKSEIGDIELTVQKPSHNADVKSVLVGSSVEAGQITPVDIVLKNTGYNDLENIYVTIRVPELGLSKTSYFGDLVAIETDDDENTVSGRIYLEVPYEVASGIYTLEVEVTSEDFSDVVERKIAIQNGFPEVAIRSGNDLLVLNPTNQLKVYKVVYPSTESIVVVQAGSSKVVPIETSDGEYNFDVFVFSGSELVGTVNFAGTSEAKELTSPVVVLTVILAIIFLVLLVVMIVLITKKPEKAEEFGESYY
jgi:hypothetical protein